MSLPKLQFSSNHELDQQMAWVFFQDPLIGGENFWETRVLTLHPDLKRISGENDPQMSLSVWIEDEYRKKNDWITLRCAQTSQAWSATQAKFEQATKGVFGDFPWPNGSYHAYGSLFGFCPRFLDEKTFQVCLFDSTDARLFVVAHEMLHFIFYAYAQKTFPELFASLDTESGVFWDLAEIFNAIMHQTEAFVDIHGVIEQLGYPAHQEAIVDLTKLWSARPQMEVWLPKAYNYLRGRS